MDLDHAVTNLDSSLNTDMDHDQLQNLASSRKRYDVFISFRGPDTRNNFVSHLHRALEENQIDTYIDDRLVRGDEVSQSLLDAIEDSEISLIIFSPNYASSWWCLDELVHILLCKENKNQTVVPVFYHVNPSDARGQRGSYEAAFVKHKQRFKDEIIQKWRAALTTAANLSGWDASKSRNDSELVKSIVEDIMKKLNSSSTSSNHLKGLVGIGKCIEEVKSLISHAQIVGIWGMGGLGKTTLAKAVFGLSYSQFQGYCFLSNIREEWKQSRSTPLQNKLFALLLKERDLCIDNTQLIKKRLNRKKLLIVLDDVDDFEQYEHLVEDSDWLNSESRVIITTRNKQVLQNIGVREIYEQQELDEDEALQLFCLNAFKRKFSPESYLEMSKKLVNYAKGVPLALKVLGSHLYSKSKVEWESALNKLKVVPNQKIQGILKISFDGLDHKEKEIFLDIACFFQGKSKDYVEESLDDSGCFADILRTLVDKSLITISNYNELRMHDLLQEMGWEIVRGEYRKELGKYSRLWIADDILHVLKNNTGTARIEGIFLEGTISEDIYLEPAVFKEMRCLRLLQISVDTWSYEIHLPQGLDSFPDELIYLKWDYYPLKSLESLLTTRNLVKLDMPCSQLEKLWSGFKHGLENLKFVSLRSSKKLTCLPDLSQSNLQRLDLHGCTSLVELPPLGFRHVLDNPTEETEQAEQIKEMEESEEEDVDDYLFNKDDFNIDCEDLSVMKCWWTSDFDGYLLDLEGCSNLKTLSNMSGNLNRMCLRLTAVEELHSSIWSLESLVFIDLSDCKCLKNLPSDICQMVSLEYLDLGGCLCIDQFPKLPGSIRGLNLSRTSIEQVGSSSFEFLPNLEILYMYNCKSLETLPTNICKLKSLKRLALSYCSKLKSFPEILEPMTCLEVVFLNGTGIRELPFSIENLDGLKILNLSHCENLESVPTSIWKLKSLTRLTLSYCSKLKSIPEIMEPMEYLEDLFLNGTGIKELQWSFGNLIKLRRLFLNGCENLESISTSIYDMCNLYHLSLLECPRLRSLPFLPIDLKEIDVDLSYSNILKISAWLNGLCSLKLLDPSGTIITGRIPIHITREPCETQPYSFIMCQCSCLHPHFLSLTWDSTRTQFVFQNHVDGYQCNEGSTRYTSHWFDFVTEFPYCDYCFELNDVQNILMTEFQLNILCTATASVLKNGKQVSDYRGISFHYLGNEIPQWFNYRTMGSSIDINFSPLWHTTGFLGFALCIIVGFECQSPNPNFLKLSCEYHFKTTYGESRKYLWTIHTKHDASSDFNLNWHDFELDWSDHVFMWHLYEDDYHDYHDATGASFNFCFDDQFNTVFGKDRVKNCGIRLLSLQDSKEFGIIKHVPGNNINSDTNEQTTF